MRFERHFEVIIKIDVTKLFGNTHIFGHTQPNESYFAVIAHCCVDCLLHAGNQRSKGSNNNAAFSLLEYLIEGWLDNLF